MKVSLRNQAYETAWGNAYKQRYIERCAQLLVIRSTQVCSSHSCERHTMLEYEICIKINGGCFHTSDIPNAWPSEDANELAGRAAVVTDWDNISHSTIVLLYDFVDDIHQAIRCRAPTEDDDFSWTGSHGAEIRPLGLI